MAPVETRNRGPSQMRFPIYGNDGLESTKLTFHTPDTLSYDLHPVQDLQRAAMRLVFGISHFKNFQP